MNGIFARAIATVIAASCLETGLRGQASIEAPPASFVSPAGYWISTALMPPVDAVAVEIQEEESAKGPGAPFRFGVPFDQTLALGDGSWSALPGGGRIWRLRVASPGAYSLNLVFSEFALAEGAMLWVYDEGGRSILGAFTAANNKPHRKFATAPTPGDSCVLELFEPAAAAGRSRLAIGRVVHAYKDLFGGGGFKGLGESGPCNINVMCPEGSPWADEIRSVGMVLVGGGTALCSGALLNNVREDRALYFLTADHCLDDEVDTWVVRFNYQSPTCANEDGPRGDTLAGATLLAHNEVSDFALVRLDEQPPARYRLHLAGWSAEDAPPSASVAIHHPRGDVKKISFDDDAAVSRPYPDRPWERDTHWEIIAWNRGTTEPGSSGAPLFDQNHRVVGQLTGGDAACMGSIPNLSPDYFGKFSRSWIGGAGADKSSRLMDWLDPDATGALTLDGRDQEDAVPVIAITYPIDGSTVMGVLTIQATASDDDGIVKVEFFVNGVLERTDLEPPYDFEWDASPLPLGSYVIGAVATDTASHSAQAQVTVRRVEPRLHIGDANCDDQVNIGDAICVLVYMFGRAGDPCKRQCCAANEDTNADREVNIADAIRILSYLFANGTLLGPGEVPLAKDARCASYPPSAVVLPCERPCE